MVNDGTKSCYDDMKRGGLRVWTMFIYLNDGSEFEGGGTIFPNLKGDDGNPLIYKLGKGDGVLFLNLEDDGYTPHKLSFHGGMPVLNGTKWGANCWVRQGEFI